MTKLTPAQQKVMNYIDRGYELHVARNPKHKFEFLRKSYLLITRENGAKHTVNVHNTTAKNLVPHLNVLNRERYYIAYTKAQVAQPLKAEKLKEAGTRHGVTVTETDLGYRLQLDEHYTTVSHERMTHSALDSIDMHVRLFKLEVSNDYAEDGF